MNNIGDRIKNRRKELGLTQMDLSKKLNISDKAVSKWEQGEGDPSTSMLPDIAKVLGVSLDYLLLGQIEDDSISLDDMDSEKRLNLLIKKDDAENFVKYEYLNSSYMFSVDGWRNLHLNDKNEKNWLQVIENKAQKIFNLCCDELIKRNPKNEFNIIHPFYSLIDEFIKMVIDVDRVDIFEIIKFNEFEIGPKPKELNVNRYNYQKIKYFIAPDTFEYLFIKKETSSQCFQYAIIKQFDSVEKAHFQDLAIKYAIKYKDFELIEKILEIYHENLDHFDDEINKYHQNDLRYNETFVRYMSSDIIIGRIFNFNQETIENLLLINNVELAKKLIVYNKEAYEKIKKLKLLTNQNVDDFYIMNNYEIDRFVKLNSLSGDLSPKEKCVNYKIIIPSEIEKLRDLKLVKEILDNNYYHYYEFVYDMIQKGNLKELYTFFIDNELDDLANYLIKNEVNYGGLLRDAWRIFTSKSGEKEYIEHKKLFGNQNELKNKSVSFNPDYECRKLENNQIFEYIKSLKENIYNNVEMKINEELKAKQEAEERAKAIRNLNRDYFESLLLSNTRNDRRSFILDLCSLLDAILKFDYKCDGEDLYGRMKNFFDNLMAQDSKNSDIYNEFCKVLHQKYDSDVVIPETDTIKHLSDIFNRLRIERNNLAHSESNEVKELNEEELKECLEFVFSIEKEEK